VARGPAHVTIVGGGAIGLCSALYLQRHGTAVTILDRAGFGAEASSSNAGLITGENCLPLSNRSVLREIPHMLLDPLSPLTIRWRYLPRIAPWLVRFATASSPARVEAGSIALASLIRLALPAYRELLTADESQSLIKESGLLHVYATTDRFITDQEVLHLRVRRGISLEILSPREAQSIEPQLTRNIRCAVYYPDTAFTVSPRRLMETLGRYFLSQGGEFRRTRVLGLTAARGSRPALVTTDGEMMVDGLVIAAGAWSRPLARALGARVPLDTERGYLMRFPNATQTSLPLIAADSHVAVTPMESGLQLAGTVEFAGLSAAPNLRRADALVEAVRPVLDLGDTTDSSRWMGFRPSIPDSLPVIGPCRRGDRVFLAFGHGHLGLSFAAVTGRLVAQAMNGESTDIPIEPFAPTRWH
jgi:D-amino-acid dehydrogenase